MLVGERQHRLYPLDIEKIDYIEADGNYVTIRVGNAEYISRDSIKRLTADLAAFGFVRIDRSILLNIRAVEFAEPMGHGVLSFTSTSGACLYSSKTYRDAILSVLPWHHCRAGARSSVDTALRQPPSRPRVRSKVRIRDHAAHTPIAGLLPVTSRAPSHKLSASNWLCNRTNHEVGRPHCAMSNAFHRAKRQRRHHSRT